MLELGYGLTNIVSRPTKEVADITKDEYKKGRLLLLKKIDHYHPKIVCFVGKGVYQEYSKNKKTKWGQQMNPVSEAIRICCTLFKCWVRMSMDEIVFIYKQLMSIIQSEGTL